MTSEHRGLAQEEWYYEDGGRSRGPVTRAQLTELLDQKFISEAARVWTASFGEHWRRAGETDLVARRPLPPPLPSQVQAPPPIGPANSDTGTQAGRSVPAEHLPNRGLSSNDGNAPARLPAAKAGLLDDSTTAASRRMPVSSDRSPVTERAEGNPSKAGAGSMQAHGTMTGAATTALPTQKPRPLNTFAYLLAFSPWIIALIDMVALSSGVDPNGNNAYVRGIPYWIAIGTVVAAVLDAKRIKRNGLNPAGRTLAPFILLTPIGYFIRRNAIVSGSMRFLWIWLGSAVVFLVVEAAMVNANE